MTYRDTFRFTWNGRQLQTAWQYGVTSSYKYDADGLRTQKIVGGVQYDYYYVNGQLRYEKKGDEYEIIYRYNNDGTLASVTRNRFSDGQTDILYAVTNTRGDVIELRSGSGAVNTVYTYDSWGKLISVTNASGTALASTNLGVQNSIRYRGYVYDTETGLYYLQSRYYDPETGRFLNADDVDFIGASGTVLSYNAFAYCENEPICSEDESGNTSSKKKKSKYYITVYTYNEIGKLDLGHIDFSLEDKIYSYGTINNDKNPDLDNTMWNKLKGKVPGYVMVSSVKVWQNYLKTYSKKVVEDKVRINLTKSEYSKLKKYIKSFLVSDKSTFSSKDIKYYKVKKCTYKYYSFTKANCSTFVRDALYACMPEYVETSAVRVSINGLNSLYMPDNVFGLAKLIGVVK